LLGILLWNFFAEVTSGSVGAIVGKGDLLRKINFPKYVIIIASSFSALINLALNFFVIAFFILLANINLSWHAFLMIPLLIELFVFSVGIAFLLSALFVRFRDVAYIWEVVLQAGFYATPVLYPVSLIPEKAAKILMLNPVAQIIQDARWALITPETQTLYSIYNNNPYIYIIPVGTTVLIAFFSSLYFRKRSKYFAEEV
jgi:ABC-2 type transport system permease protein